MPKLPSTCKYCGADSTEFVFDDSSGQLTCTACGSQLGGVGRIDFSVTGESLVYDNDGNANASERVNAPVDPLWEGLDGDSAAAEGLRAERSEGFRIIEKASSNLDLSRVCMELAKTHFKDVHMRKTLCATYKPIDADADADGSFARHELFKSQAKELSRMAIMMQAAACVYIAARSDGQGRTIKEILGAFKEWHLANKQLNTAFRTISRILDIEVPILTAGSKIQHWAERLHLPAAVARAAAEIADNCSRITVPRSVVEVVNFATMQQLLGLGYAVVQQITPSLNTAGVASQIMYKLEKYDMHSLADGTIATTASGALYCASFVCGDAGLVRTTKEISDVTGAAEVGGIAAAVRDMTLTGLITIRKQVKEMVPHLDKLLPPMYGDPVLMQRLAEQYRHKKSSPAAASPHTDPSAGGQEASEAPNSA